MASRHCRAFAGSLIVWLVSSSLGCATHESWKTRAKRWGLRGVGTVAAYAVHEGCHLALGAALGGDVSPRFEGPRLILGFGGLSPAENRAVAFAGTACTGVASEFIVDFGKHKTSDIAWGFAAFHAFNSTGYAFSSHGDAEYFRGAGGDPATWTTINALHGARIGGQLGWDAGIGNYVIRLWQRPAIMDRDIDPLPRGIPRADGSRLLSAAEGEVAIGSEPPSYSSETFQPSFANAVEMDLLPEGWEPPSELEIWTLSKRRPKEGMFDSSDATVSE